MHAYQIAFNAALAVAVIAALRFGGREERIGALLVFVAACLSPLAVASGYDEPEIILTLVDVGLFGGLLIIALHSSRFWPLWAAGFQLGALAVHLAALVIPHLMPKVYATTLGIWAYPVLTALALGAWIEGRRPSLAQ